MYFMSDINLLPEELKKREREALEKQAKKPKIIEVKLTAPGGEAPATARGFWKKVPEKNGAVGVPKAPSGIFQGKEGEGALTKAPDFIRKESVVEKEVTKEGLAKAHKILDEDVSIKDESVKEVPEKVGESAGNGDVVKPRIIFDDATGKASGFRKFISLSWWKENWTFFVNKIRGERNGEVAVNLMPEDLSTIKDVEWMRIGSILGGCVLISFAIIVIGYFILLGRLEAERREFTDLQNSIQAFAGEIEMFASDKEKALATHRKITAVNELLKNHVHWTRFLSLLEANTLDDVSFSGLSGNAGENITLSGNAKDLSTLLSQREVLSGANNFISGVDMSDVKTTESGITFSMVLHVLPDVWKGGS